MATNPSEDNCLKTKKSIIMGSVERDLTGIFQFILINPSLLSSQ